MPVPSFDIDFFLAEASVPSAAPVIREPGVYAILLAPTGSLPGIEPGTGGLLYIGMTDATLEARSHFGHAHSGFSTLRRSLGAILRDQLGLSATPRGPGPSSTNLRNYRFSDAGELALSAWMMQHLLIAQAPVAAGVDQIEKDLITTLEPPLNLTGWRNPQRPAIKALRARCVDEARAQRRP